MQDSTQILVVCSKICLHFLFEEIIQGLTNRMEFRREFALEIQALIDELNKQKTIFIELLENR